MRLLKRLGKMWKWYDEFMGLGLVIDILGLFAIPSLLYLLYYVAENTIVLLLKGHL